LLIKTFSHFFAKNNIKGNKTKQSLNYANLLKSTTIKIIMALKKQENFIWDFGFYNALRFIQTAWKYSDIFEILLNEIHFQGKLNIHISIDGDKIFKTKLKKQNFQNLKLSKWKKRDAVFSALTYVFETDSKNNKLLSNIRFYIRDQISYICNELYSKDILQLYKKFNFFQLYPDKCIVGCKDVFMSSDYSSKHSFYLNHIGLQNYLNELNINVKIFSEIKILCNKNHNYTFFVLFLEKYIFNNYKIFFKQAKYDYLLTTTQFFTLKNSNDFINCNSFDYETFSLEFNQTEQQRVVTLVKISLQKKNKIITQKSKQIFIYVYNSKPIKYTSGFILIAFIMGYYFAKSAFAIPTTPNPPSGLQGPATTMMSANFSATPETLKKSRKPRTPFTAPYYNPENLGLDATTDQSVINREGAKSFLEMEQKNREKSKLARLKRLVDKTKSLVTELQKQKPSDASSDVGSNVPVTPSYSLYTTNCKIINGRLYNDAKKSKVTATSEFDTMIDMDSFQKFPEKCFFWNRTIYRAKIKPDKLKPFSEQPYYVLYYPNGPNTYRLSVCPNIGQASELKAVARQVREALKKNNKYTFDAMTFEHGVSNFHLRTYVIGMTDRSNTKDTSFGLMIPDSLNKKMGSNLPNLNDVYTKRNLNMFTETEQVNFSGVILQDYYNDYVKLGEKQIDESCFDILKKELNKASRTVRTQLTPKVYDKLPAAEKKRRVHSSCSNAVRKKLNGMTLANNSFFDKDIFSLTKEHYKWTHDQHREKVKRYSTEWGVKVTQTSSCAFIDQLVTKARENLAMNYKSIEYKQLKGSTKKLPCPIENGVQQLQTAMDISEAVELIDKQAQFCWPNDMQMGKFVKRKLTELSYINQDYASRAETNLDMTRKVDDNLLHVYEKEAASISESTPEQTVQNLNEENSSITDDDTESVVSIANQSVENNLDEAYSSSDESETNWKEIPIPNRDAYVLPLKEKLKVFNEKREQSENRLNSPIGGQTDYVFITPENKDLNCQETHDYLFRGNKINLNNGQNIIPSYKQTRFVDSFYDENIMKRSTSGELLTPAAEAVTEAWKNAEGSI